LWNNLHPKTFTKQYKNHLSDFLEWVQIVDIDALVFPENFGPHMALDEVMLLNHEYYTILTNKDAKGKKGCLAAIIKGTKAKVVSEALAKVPIEYRMKVKEVSLDLAPNMDWIARTNFMNASLVGDRFHVQKVVSEAVQETRLKYRREAIDEENEAIAEAKKNGKKYESKYYENDETKKQLLARSRYILSKPKSRWTKKDISRSVILFREFPEIEKTYHLSMNFRGIFETAKTKETARIRIKEWVKKVNKTELTVFLSSAKTIENHLGKILNYFPHKSTNASAESFNSKLKGFRSIVRGVRDPRFFLFRICKFYS